MHFNCIKVLYIYVVWKRFERPEIGWCSFEACDPGCFPLFVMINLGRKECPSQTFKKNFCLFLGYLFHSFFTFSRQNIGGGRGVLIYYRGDFIVSVRA